MIHEVLLHLWSNLSEPHVEDLKFEELQEFLHPGELELLKNIIATASSYHKIVAYCKKIENGRNDKQGANVGLYVEALASGITDVLEDYCGDVERLEETFLENPQLPLLYIVTCMQKHETLFEFLLSIIKQVEGEGIRGLQLFGRFHKYLQCGIESISSVAETIIRKFNTIFYEQLGMWIIYGELSDSDEFFICDEKRPDEEFLYPEQLEPNDSSALQLSKKIRLKRPPIVQKFSINWQMVPVFLRAQTVESILFLGRIVWVIKNDPRKTSDDQYQINIKQEIWDGRDVEYYKKIQAFEEKRFNDKDFNSAIEECRIKLTEYLFGVMSDEANLKEHLQMIRDYYCLGRGELFHEFLVAAEANMATIIKDRNMRNLNVIFAETARQIYGDDRINSKFGLLSTIGENAKANPLSHLELNFEVGWPLHLIFTPKLIALYNKLFAFLLRLNKTQIHLQKLWRFHMSSKQKIDRRVWTLRQKLTFLVNNLQYYLQVDVIEAEFSILMKGVQNANDFGDIIKFHYDFVCNILAKTFIQTSNAEKNTEVTASNGEVVPSKVHNVIVRLLRLCDEFCFAACIWEVELGEPELSELEKFQKRTETTIDCLLFILNSSNPKSERVHLIQLLHLLDFNRFFTKSKTNFNISLT